MNVSPSRARILTLPLRPKVSFHYQTSPNSITSSNQHRAMQVSPNYRKIIHKQNEPANLLKSNHSDAVSRQSLKSALPSFSSLKIKNQRPATNFHRKASQGMVPPFFQRNCQFSKISEVFEEQSQASKVDIEHEFGHQSKFSKTSQVEINNIDKAKHQICRCGKLATHEKLSPAQSKLCCECGIQEMLKGFEVRQINQNPASMEQQGSWISKGIDQTCICSQISKESSNTSTVRKPSRQLELHQFQKDLNDEREQLIRLYHDSQEQQKNMKNYYQGEKIQMKHHYEKIKIAIKESIEKDLKQIQQREKQAIIKVQKKRKEMEYDSAKLSQVNFNLKQSFEDLVREKNNQLYEQSINLNRIKSSRIINISRHISFQDQSEISRDNFEKLNQSANIIDDQERIKIYIPDLYQFFKHRKSSENEIDFNQQNLLFSFEKKNKQYQASQSVSHKS